VSADPSQLHPQQHGLHHRGRQRAGNDNGTIPPENGMLFEILGERGWNTYMVANGTVPHGRDEPRLDTP